MKRVGGNPHAGLFADLAEFLEDLHQALPVRLPLVWVGGGRVSTEVEMHDRYLRVAHVFDQAAHVPHFARAGRIVNAGVEAETRRGQPGQHNFGGGVLVG